MRRFAAMIVGVMAAAVWGAPALAQRVARGAMFNNGSLEELLRESKEKNRLLIVFYVGGRMTADQSRDTEKMRERTFRNPTVALWIQWHALITEVNEAEKPAQFASLRTALRTNSAVPKGGLLGGRPVDYGAPPRILVFKDGKLVRVLPDPAQSGEKYKGGWTKGDSENKFVSPAGLLLRLDMLMDGLASTDPGWLERHNRDNPPPTRPEPRRYSAVGDDNGLAVEDPPAPENEPPDVLAMLEEARLTKRGRNLHEATGLYTWLWERGAEVDPAFEAARTVLLPWEIGDLCSARKASAARFRAIFDETIHMGLWVTWHERFSWMMLGAQIGRSDDYVEAFDFMLDDIDEGPITPREDRAIAKEMTRYNPTADPYRVPRDGGKAIIEALDGGPPLKQAASGATWDAMRETRRWIAGIEARRAYGACLRAGRDAEAATIGAAVVEHTDDAPTRVSLVMTALAFGQARPDHLRLLDEAAARGMDRPTLRVRVSGKLAEVAAPAPVVPTPLKESAE